MKMTEWSLVFLLIFLWLIYFVTHSLLASDSAKLFVQKKLPKYASCYRLLYNTFALIALAPIVYLQLTIQSETVVIWHGWLVFLSYGINAFALAGFIWSLRYYDMPSFIGIKGCRRQSKLTMALSISPLHCYVRHPWYFFALLIIWSRDLTVHELVSNLAITSYLIVGSRLEDKKLITEFGLAYADYANKVPGIIPLPGRSITKSEANKLEKQSIDLN